MLTNTCNFATFPKLSMKVHIKNRVRREDEFQFFMHDFVDACIANDFSSVSDFFPSYKYHIRSLLRRGELLLYNRFPPKKTRKKALIVTANGGTIAENYFPYYFNYELIPMLWDVWPSTWLQMQHDFQRFKVRTVLVTVREVAEMINSEMNGIKALWVPEGIKTSLYHKGEELQSRPFDILELGRQMKPYHQMLERLNKEGKLEGWTTSFITRDGRVQKERLTFPDNETLYRQLPKYKLMVCFPQCDTNPFRAGHIETLTQRYWEAMLSGCLMIGRAPQELIDFIGYNPVVNVNWDNPEDQLIDIIVNISKYQELVDTNLEAAQLNAPWEKRLNSINEFLVLNGYNI